MHLLLNKGGLYKVYNGNLLYHGCVPLNEDGSFKQVRIYDKVYQGKSLYDALEIYVRKAFFALIPKRRNGERIFCGTSGQAPTLLYSGKIR